MRKMYCSLLLLLFLSAGCTKSTPKVRVNILAKYGLKKIIVFTGKKGLYINGKNVGVEQTAYIFSVQNGHVFVEVAGKELQADSFYLFSALSSESLRLGFAGKRRNYLGGLYIYADNDKLVLVNSVPLKDYLASVTYWENFSLVRSFKQDREALKAAAVAIRSYTLYSLQADQRRHSDKRFQLCDLTHCQVYKGTVPMRYRRYMRQIIQKTRAKVLKYKNSVVPGFYSSTCGGISSTPHEAWGGNRFSGQYSAVHDRVPASEDPLCVRSPHYRWHYKMGREEFLKFFREKFFPVTLADLQITRGPTGRIVRLESLGRSVDGYKFRNGFCKKYGWHTLKTLFVDIMPSGKDVIFRGRGLGHGVGMCQYGSFTLSRLGYSWKKILRHYYPKLSVESF